MQTDWLFRDQEYDPVYGHMPEWIPRPWTDCTEGLLIGKSPFPRLAESYCCFLQALLVSIICCGVPKCCPLRLMPLDHVRSSSIRGLSTHLSVMLRSRFSCSLTLV